MSKETCRLEEGRNLYPLECRLSAGRHFSQKPRKCHLETRASLIFIFRVLLFGIWVIFHTKYASSCPSTKYLYLRLPFLTMKEFRIIIVSRFSYSGEVWLYKIWKIERLDARYMFDSRIFLKDAVITPWNSLINPTSWLSCFAVLLKTFLNICKQFVRRMDRGLVEHLDELAMNLCLYGFLCIFGIQYIY